MSSLKGERGIFFKVARLSRAKGVDNVNDTERSRSDDDDEDDRRRATTREDRERSRRRFLPAKDPSRFDRIAVTATVTLSIDYQRVPTSLPIARLCAELDL